MGSASSASRRSASPTPTCRRPSRGCWSGSAQGWHGEMEYMARHGALRARPAELKPGTLRVISCRMNYLNDVPQETRAEAGAGAYIARYARGRDYHKVLRDRLQKLCDRIAARAGRVRLPRVHRLGAGDGGRARGARRASAGAASTRCSSAATPARGSSWARSTATCRCRWTQPKRESLRHLRALHRRLPDAGDPRPLPARRAALHLLPHHRAQERDPRGAAAADRQPRLRLRRLPAGLPVERLRAADRRRRTSRSRNGLDRATLVELFAWTEAEFDQRLQGLADPPHRLRALAAQPRGRAWAMRRPRYTWWPLCGARKDHPSALVREHVALGTLARHERLAA